MHQVRSSRSDYTGFMVNRLGLAAVLLALAAPSEAENLALSQARGLSGGSAATYDGGCTGGSCGAAAPACEGEACRIKAASDGALKTGDLVVNKEGERRPTMRAVVPAPSLGADKEGSKDKPGFFGKLFSGKGLMYGLGGAATGAGVGFLLGGPLGALIGGLLGAVAGLFLSKMLAK